MRISGGSGLSLRSDDLDSVGELYTEDELRQLVVAIEATPASLGGLGELEDHGERCEWESRSSGSGRPSATRAESGRAGDRTRTSCIGPRLAWPQRDGAVDRWTQPSIRFRVVIT